MVDPVRLVTVYGPCTEELRKAVMKAAKAEGHDVTWSGPNMNVLKAA